jgi:hypothetical protein
MSRYTPLERNPVNDYFDTMPNPDKYQGRHILPACSSLSSLMDGGSIKSESRALLSNESPKNPD